MCILLSIKTLVSAKSAEFAVNHLGRQHKCNSQEYIIYIKKVNSIFCNSTLYRYSPRLKTNSPDYSREFMMVLYVMSNGTPEENLIQIFRIFDINTDGLLSPKEVEKVVKYLFKIFPQKEYPDEASQKVLAKKAFKARSIKRGV